MKFNKFAVGLGLMFAASAGLCQSYTISDVGTLPSTNPYSAGTAISNSGEVVGYATVGANSSYRPISYANGVIHNLGTLPEAADNASASAFAFGVNDSEQVVGYGLYGVSAQCCHAFLYSKGKMRDLGTLGGAGTSLALAINKSGVVVGQSDAPRDKPYVHAIRYDGVMHDIGHPPGYLNGGAVAINTSGQILVFGFTLGSSLVRGFLYSGGEYHDIGLPPLMDRSISLRELTIAAKLWATQILMATLAPLSTQMVRSTYCRCLPDIQTQPPTTSIILKKLSASASAARRPWL